MVSKVVGERIGFWDEDYFFYGEDVDFCYRIKQGGYKVMYYPQVMITHLKGASSGIRSESKAVTRATREIKVRLAVASTEAMKIFYRKHWMEEYPKMVTRLVFIGIGILKLFRILRFRLAKG